VENLWDAEDETPVGNLLENIHTSPLPKLHHLFLIAGGAEVAALAGTVIREMNPSTCAQPSGVDSAPWGITT